MTGLIGYDAPYWDQWWKIPLIVESIEGTIGLSDYWSLINEHRVFFPNLITIPLAGMTNWTIGLELILTLIFAIVAFLLLSSCIIKKDPRSDSRGLWPIVPVISLLMFSYSQDNIWMWGLHLMIPMTLLAMLITIHCLIRDEIAAKNLITAILFAIIASYSFGAGIVIWGVGGVLLVVRVIRKIANAKAFLAAWCLACVFTMSLYFVGYESTPSDSAALSAIQHPLSFLQYVIAYLGAPLAPYGNTAPVLMGVFGFGLMVYFGRRTWRSTSWSDAWGDGRVRLAVSLILLAVGCATLTALKQWPEGPQQAASSRYLAWSTMFWVAILLLSRTPACPNTLRRNLFVFIVAFGLIASVHGAYRAEERHDAFELGREALITNTNDAHLLYLYPTPDVPTEMRADLINYKLSVFRFDSNRDQSHE